ncbi:MAG: glycoside hydrolase family 2 TIM barrel-domain containing protein, partial [Bacteroidia bacterium]
MLTIRAQILTLLIGLTFCLPVFAQVKMEPIKVEVRQDENGYQLYRDGKPYYVKGVGGQDFLDEAVACGANSIRTWAANDAAKVLDDAHARGLTVLFGLWVGQERQGFDYDDTKSVKAQFEQFHEVVKKYKNHPAILMWGIGNENDLMYSDYRVWNAINDIAKMIHEEDPNHPTMTVTAGIDVAEVQLIMERAPEIDIYGINTYGGLIGVDKEIRSYGWDGPYMITEWGPNGHWEVPTTEWGAPIEQSSSVKADYYRKRYELGIAADRERCLGSYVFLW